MSKNKIPLHYVCEKCKLYLHTYPPKEYKVCPDCKGPVKRIDIITVIKPHEEVK